MHMANLIELGDHLVTGRNIWDERGRRSKNKRAGLLVVGTTTDVLAIFTKARHNTLRSCDRVALRDGH